MINVCPLLGGHIYFQYALKDSEVYSEAIGDHPITEPPVGGAAIPIDIFDLLTPYVDLAITVLVVVVTPAAYAGTSQQLSQILRRKAEIIWLRDELRAV